MTEAENSATARSAALEESKYQPLELVTRPVLTTKELCHYANIREQTAWAWACKESGPVRPVRIGRRLGWPTAAVKKLCGVEDCK